MTPRVWNKRDPNCPKDAVYIGRPSKWGNPFRIDQNETREQAIEDFRMQHMGIFLSNEEVRRELRGKDLVCWYMHHNCFHDAPLVDIGSDIGISYWCCPICGKTWTTQEETVFPLEEGR